jgi:lipoprotein signal peptidase
MSDRCEDLVIMATLWSVGVQVLLVIVCGAAFRRSKRVTVKRTAAVGLATGMVGNWVVFDRIMSMALVVCV